jgi:hypothetical protein
VDLHRDSIYFFCVRVYICMCVHRFSYELLLLSYKVKLIYLFHDKLSIKLEIWSSISYVSFS